MKKTNSNPKKGSFPPHHHPHFRPWIDFLGEIQCPVSLLIGLALWLGELPETLGWGQPFPGKESQSSTTILPGFHINILTSSCEDWQEQQSLVHLLRATVPGT